MPVVAVNIPAHVFRKISELVARGEYASPEDFLTTAAFNQIALENAAKASAPTGVQVDETQGSGASPSGVVVAHSAAPASAARQEAAEVKGPRADQRAGGRWGNPSIHKLCQRLALSSWKQESVPASLTSVSPLDGRIWGQVNRLFPLKFALRWLAVEAARGEWPQLLEALEPMANDAALLGSHLEALDGVAGRQRDEQLATGLPRLGNAASQERFMNHVVARTTRASEVPPGAIFQYAMATRQGERICLTKDGLQLAALHNPILDDAEEASRALTQAEQEVFLSVIQRHLPREASDIAAVLAKVREGHITPNALHLEVRAILPAEWTDIMVRTQISGLVSRMVDLGLLGRHWAGRHVNYFVTDAGKALFG